MSMEAGVFAGILATLVDPRTSDHDLAELVRCLEVEDLRDALVCVAAAHSGCIQEMAERSGADVRDIMRRVQHDYRRNLIEAEETS